MSHLNFSSYLEAATQENLSSYNAEEGLMTHAKRAVKLYSSSKYNEGCKSPSQCSEASHQSTEYTEGGEDDCSQSMPNGLFIQRTTSRSTTVGNEQLEFAAFDEVDESVRNEEKINIEEDEVNQEATEETESQEIKNWCERKDKILKNLASKCKYDWKKIAKKFNTSEQTNLTPLALKQKYKELSRVSIPLRVKFSHQEDLLIAKYFETYGCDWTAIASHFADRTAMMLKNRYYSFIRKRNLLQDMLDEVKDTDEVDDTVREEVPASIMPIQTPQEVEKLPVSFISQNQENIIIRRFSMSNYNPIVFEIENSLSCQLYDRITEIL